MAESRPAILSGAQPFSAAPHVTAKPARAPLWTVRGTMGKTSYRLVALASFLLLLVVWFGLTASGFVDPMFLPGPVDVAEQAWSWATTDDLLGNTGISVYRVMAGFALSAVMAVPLGLYIGAFMPVRAFFEPLMEFSRYLPAVAFMPLVLLWAGIGEPSKIALIWIGTFFQMVLMISDDVSRVPMSQIEAARTLGATNAELVHKVLLRSALPGIFDTLRLTLGFAWTYLVVAELVAANSGVGYAIMQAQRFLQTDRIFVGIIDIGLIGLITDQTLRFIHRKLFPWARK